MQEILVLNVNHLDSGQNSTVQKIASDTFI